MLIRNQRRIGASLGAATLFSAWLLVGILAWSQSARAEEPAPAAAPAKNPASQASPAKEPAAKEPNKEPAKEPTADAPAAEKPAKDAAATKEPSKEESEKPPQGEPSATPQKAASSPKKSEKLVPFDRPRQWLALFGVDDSYFDRVLDGQEVDESDSEALLRMLHAVRRFPPLEMFRLQSLNASWAEWAEKPTEHRGDLTHLDGKLVRVSLEQPVPEVVERFMIDHYYRCEFLIGDQEAPATIFTLDIPNAWKRRTAALLTAQGALAPIVAPEWTIDQHFSERVSIEGFFYKRAGEPPEPRPVFITKRIAWHSHTPLGDLGMDVGLLDEVRMKAPLTSEDRECFFEMLAAVGRADNQELNRLTDRKYSVVPLFNHPDGQKGELVALVGTARRALRLQVGEGDADIVKRYGMDHYYEIEIYTGDSQRNPVIFCVREIPHGMPTGDEIDVDVRIAGFFMKTYSFTSHRKVDEKGNKIAPGARKQLAPLLIGRKALLLIPEKSSNELTGWIAGVALAAVVLAICFITWQFNREGKKFRETTLNKYKHGVDTPLKDVERR